MIDDVKTRKKAPEMLAEQVALLEQELLKKENKTHAQEKIIADQAKIISLLNEKLRLQRARQFGKKSEQHIEDYPQALLFDEVQLPENIQEIEQADEEITVPEHTRQKGKTGRKPLPAHLPRVEHIHDLSDVEKQCACGCQMHCIGDERSEQLDIIPAKMQVIVNVRKKYACKRCEENGVTQATLPPQPIPKSMASPGLLAYLCVSKFEDYLPLYRLERILKRIGVDIPRATTSFWMIRCSRLLLPLYKSLQYHINAYDVASADETPLQVLKEVDRDPEKKSYMWVFSGGPPNQPAVLYHYAPTRSHQVLNNILEDFDGYLHCDGYSGYDAFASKSEHTIKQVGCWYHVRRYFMDAEKISSKTGLATEAVRTIKKLAKIEKAAKKLTPEGRKRMRQKSAKPMISAFKKWLEEYAPHVPPASTLGIAFRYTLNQWPKLLTYLDDGRLEISNNHTERAVKPFVMGRKNWLFANSVDGANAAAIIYSIIETCKLNQLPTYDYLRYLFTHLPSCETLEDYEKLLPFNIDKKIFLK